jgi:hypothetical protein
MTSYMYKKQQKMQNLSHVPVTGPSSHPKGPLARLGSGHELLGHRPSLCPSERPLSSPSERCGSDPRSVWQVKRVVSRLVGRIESFPVGDTTPKAEYFEPPRQEKGFNFFWFFFYSYCSSHNRPSKTPSRFLASARPKSVKAKGLRWLGFSGLSDLALKRWGFITWYFGDIWQLHCKWV